MDTIIRPSKPQQRVVGNPTTSDGAENSAKAKNVRQSGSLVHILEKSNTRSILCELGDNGIEDSGRPPLSAAEDKVLGLFLQHPKAVLGGKPTLIHSRIS